LDFYRNMGYTALCVGKRDLAGSTIFLVEETRKRGLRPLSSNLHYKGKAVFESYGIFGVNSVKVGVLAVTSPELSQRIKANGVEVLDPSARLKSLVPEIKNRVDLIVLLSNLGEFEDRSLASIVDDIDVIIGSGPGGQRYQPLKVGKTYILRGNIKGKSVGKVRVKLDSEGGIQELNNELYQLNARLPVDEATIRKTRELKQKYLSKRSGVQSSKVQGSPKN
jgi:2',3'-cyclic-nucleotide 2'-phosphodiesterase (5'-nucleotidase family)